MLSAFRDDTATNDRAPLGAFLLLAKRQSLWRTSDPGPDFAEAVRRYEAATAHELPLTEPPPSFGTVTWPPPNATLGVTLWLAGPLLRPALH